TGDEEAVGTKVLGGPAGQMPVSLENIGAFDLDRADFAAGTFAPAAVGDPYTDLRQRKSDRPRDALAVIGIGRDHPSLGHAVALEDLVAGAPGELPVGLGE